MKQFILFLVLYFCSLEDTQIGEGGAGPLLSLERCHQQEPEPPGAQAGRVLCLPLLVCLHLASGRMNVLCSISLLVTCSQVESGTPWNS